MSTMMTSHTTHCDPLNTGIREGLIRLHQISKYVQDIGMRCSDDIVEYFALLILVLLGLPLDYPFIGTPQRCHGLIRWF